MIILATKIANSSLEKWPLHIFHVFVFCALGYSVVAQSGYKLEVVGDLKNAPAFDHIEIDGQDSVQVKSTLEAYILDLRKKGNWLASLDSLHFDGDRAVAHLYIGERYITLNINKVHLTGSADLELSFFEKKIKGSYSLDKIESMYQWALNYCGDNGYPFATVELDSFSVNNKTLDCGLVVNPGRKIRFDSLRISPEGLVRYGFISKHLGIAYDDPFSQAQVDAISKRLMSLPFLKLAQPPEVYFALQKSRVSLALAEKKVNSFDGILGLVPGTADRSPDLTGEVKFDVKNLFKGGKELGFHWKKITTKTQQLDVNYYHPFLLASPFNFQMSFNQLKENISFSNRQLLFGLEYATSAISKLRVFYENKSGNSLEDVGLENGDFNLDNYGLGFYFNNLDQPDSPKNGFRGNLSMQIGQKRIAGNSLNQNGQDQRNSDQYMVSADLARYHSIGPRSVLFFKAAGGLIENQKLFLNDLFRLGGLKSVRGFNENFFFASRYVLLNFEWQMYLEDNSYFFIFFDQSFLERDTYLNSSADEPSGLGLGMKVASKGGFFNIVYGLGRSRGQGFSFEQSKIHFGYTALF
ncbi:MAG: ShlB/FhaC/HecB family hemolysin secretion/activation protein [Cyclobacteriaceae bacterium]